MKHKKCILWRRAIIWLAILLLIIAFIIPKSENKLPEPIGVIDDYQNLAKIEFGNKPNIQILNYSTYVSGYCNEWKIINAEILNNDNNPANVVFLLENTKKLKFFYPKEFIIPPNSQKEINFFVILDCSIREAKPLFKIENADLSFSVNIEAKEY